VLLITAVASIKKCVAPQTDDSIDGEIVYCAKEEVKVYQF